MKLLLVLLLAAVSAFSQTVISVDENVSKNSDKSWLLAMGASAVLPGMGERYLGEQQFVRPFVWTDIVQLEKKMITNTIIDIFVFIIKFSYFIF